MTSAGGAGASCPACGASNGPAARFCGVCGAAIASTGAAPAPLASEPHAMIGREIAGRYRVLGKLGEGGMGAVFRAEQISLKRSVAVKLLRPDMSADRTLVRRFNAEAELVAKLSHPSTVNIYDFGQDSDGTLFIVMELIEGRSLRSVIQREAPLALPRALAIATQVAASLSDAHRRAIVHRDLKPDNVMLQDRGRERDVVRVLDFGIAKLRDDARATHQAMTQQGDMLGTPQYMAPEQIRGEPVDGRTDVYALGCLLYEMVTGRLPHEAQTVLAMLSKHLLEAPVPPSQRRPELGLPVAVDALILGAMAKDPRARPAAMDAFSEQIAALARHLGEPGGAPSTPGIATPPAYSAVSAGPPGGPSSASVPPGVGVPPGTAPGGTSPVAAVWTPVPPDPGAPGAVPGGSGPGGAAHGLGAATPGAPVPGGASSGGGGPAVPGGAAHGLGAVMPGAPVPGGASSGGGGPAVPGGAAHGLGAATPGVPVPGGGAPVSGGPAGPAGQSGPAAALGIPQVAGAAPSTAGARPVPARRWPVALAVAGVAVAAVAGAGLWLAQRDRAAAPADAGVARDAAVVIDPWAPPVHTAQAADPWAPTARATDDTLEIGQGVRLTTPPGFRVARQGGNATAVDARGIVIAGSPIAISPDDAHQWGVYYARASHLELDTTRTIAVAGAARPVAVCHGTVAGVAVVQTALLLVGSGYSVVVVLQFPRELHDMAEVERIAMDVFTRRIQLP